MLARSTAAALILLMPWTAWQSRSPVVPPPSDGSEVTLRGSVSLRAQRWSALEEESLVRADEPPRERNEPSLSVAIRAGFELDGEVVHEAKLRSDEEGRFELSWLANEAWLSAPAGTSRGVFAEVEERGFQRRRIQVDVERIGQGFRTTGDTRVIVRDPDLVSGNRPGNSGGQGALRLWSLPLLPGGSLEALVLDPSGIPRTATIQGWRRTDAGDVSEVDLTVEMLAPGRYLAHFDSDPPETLSASNADVGVGHAVVEESRPLKIVLSRGAELHGRVADLDGRPLAGIRLKAEWAQDPTAAQDLLREEDARVEGVATGSVQTDAEGCFDFRCLIAGSYMIRGTSPLPNWALWPEVHSTGPEPRTIVARYQRLLVEQSSEGQSRARDAKPFCRRRENVTPDGAIRWTNAPGMPASLQAGSDSSYLLEPGATYVAGLWSATRGLVEQEFVAEGRRVERNLRLELPPEVAHARLRAVLHVPEGDPLRDRSLKLRTLSWSTGCILKGRISSVGSMDSITYEERLPADRYRIEVASGLQSISEQQDVSLEPGGTVEVHLWPKSGR